MFRMPMCLGMMLLLPMSAQAAAHAQDKILSQLKSSGKQEKVEAIQKITELDEGREAYLQDLVPLLAGPDQDVANQAAIAIGSMGPKAISAASSLVDHMNDLLAVTSDREQLWIVFSHALAEIGPEVVPILIERIPDANLAQYLGICAALHDLGGHAAPAVPALIEKGRGQDNTILWSTLYAMEGVGPAAVPAIPLILDALHRDDFQMPLIACRVIVTVGSAAKDAKPKLFELTASEVPSTRSRAAVALGAIGFTDGDDEQVLKVLVKLLHDPNQVVKERAAIGLGKLGSAALPVVEEVRAAANSNQFSGRSEACLALWRITGNAEESLSILTQLFENIEHDLTAIAAVGEMGGAAGPAVPALLKVLDHEDESYAIEALKSLARIGPAASPAIAKLKQFRNHFDPEIQTLAKKALLAIEQPDTR